MKKKHLTYIYILVNIVIIVMIGVLDPHIESLKGSFTGIKLKWLAGGFACMIVYWMCDAYILNHVVNNIFKPKSFLKCLKAAIIGQYYNSVTPFASGGQPSIVYYLSKSGVPAGFATSSLMIKFFMYQVVLTLYCFVSFVARAGYIYSYSKMMFFLALVGLVITTGSVFMVYALSGKKTLIKKIVFTILKFAHKIKLIKDLDKVMKNMLTHVNDFHRGLDIIKDDIKLLAKIFMLTFLQLTFFFSITYFIYKSFGLDMVTWLDIVFIQSFLYLAVSYFPTPGAAGASEGGFYIVFKLFFSHNIIFVAMLLWRIISYYMNVIVGSIVVVADSIITLSDEDKKIVNE